MIGPGSAANSTKLTLTSPGNTPEIFDNIPGTGATFWSSLVSAINHGNAVRGPSQLVVATLGTNTSAAIPSYLPTANQTLAGGTDGASGVDTALLLGTDGNARKGMYALRGHGLLGRHAGGLRGQHLVGDADGVCPVRGHLHD